MELTPTNADAADWKRESLATGIASFNSAQICSLYLRRDPSSLPMVNVPSYSLLLSGRLKNPGCQSLGCSDYLLTELQQCTVAGHKAYCTNENTTIIKSFIVSPQLLKQECQTWALLFTLASKAVEIGFQILVLIFKTLALEMLYERMVNATDWRMLLAVLFLWL